MKILYGNVPVAVAASPEADEGLHPIHGPNKAWSTWIATFTGFLLILPLTLICLGLSTFAIPGTPGSTQPVAWGAVVAAIVSYIPLHELLHLVWHPRLGASDRSFLVIWPTKLQFGVYYEGCMSRARWLLMRLAPLLLLSVLPAAFWAVFRYVALTRLTSTFLAVMTILNCVGSGADVAGCFVVLSQVPRSAVLCFRGGKAYWMEAAAHRGGLSPSSASS